MQKCFWYVIITGLMMIYGEWALRRNIISTPRGDDRSNNASSVNNYLWSIPSKETIQVEPVSLLAIKERRLKI